MEQVLPPYGTSFAALWHQFCRLMAPVLPPYGASFAILWHEFYGLMGRVLPPYGASLSCVKFLKRRTKVCYIFLGGWRWGRKSLSMDSLLLSKTLGKLLFHLQSNSVITNRTGQARFVRYIWVDLKTK